MAAVMDRIMAELIDYGGAATGRAAAYSNTYQAARSIGAPEDTARRCADRAAFGPLAEKLSPEQSSALLTWEQVRCG